MSSSRSNPNIWSLNFDKPQSNSFTPTNEPHAIVCYPYKAASTDELTCEVNDIVTLKREIDENWIYATNNRTGQSGIVPLLFLTIKVSLAPTHNKNNAINSGNIMSINERNRQNLNQDIKGKALFDYTTNVEGDLQVNKFIVEH